MIGSSFHIPTVLGRIRVFLLDAFWIVPALATIAALLLARWTSTLDYTTPIRFGGLLTTSGPSGARDMVQTVANSSLSVVTLVFSIMIVVLQVAGSQYSPRLPAQFLRDMTTQVVLGIFVFTFVFSLSIVRSIGAASDFVPTFAVTACFLAAIFCVAAFIHFIHHTVHSMRVEMVLDHIREETVSTLRRRQRRHDPSVEFAEMPIIPDHAAPLFCPVVGTLQNLDGSGLVETAKSEGVVVCFVVLNGDTLAAGTPIAWIWKGDAKPRSDCMERLDKRIRKIIQLGNERTFRSDFGFGIIQLIDIALRSLSTAVNDPTTACMSIRAIEGVMSELARGNPRTRHFCDDDGELRVVVPERSFADYLGDAVGSISRAAPDDVMVGKALLGLLHDLAYAARSVRHKSAVAAQVTRVEQLCLNAMTDDCDRSEIRVSVMRSRRALRGEPPVYL
ncbi:DUF2254 domain-containing protein [Salipiger sp. IMCC34102]|uniref:DUF2254 domain-containing protein n=1 Tax=Salipiger sp. IMCC34102 TaxID=2510647 RepID=UPI00101C39ED|nr:DUF2254 domain-containing protein [Salipiger sp. IMCC34102]RYH02557.1 DUF2254 domain-containing protein [Salipiger sp. IMCC34102]